LPLGGVKEGLRHQCVGGYTDIPRGNTTENPEFQLSLPEELPPRFLSWETGALLCDLIKEAPEAEKVSWDRPGQSQTANVTRGKNTSCLLRRLLYLTFISSVKDSPFQPDLLLHGSVRIASKTLNAGE